MRILKENAIGLIIDIQEKLFPHMYGKEMLEKNLIKLITGLKILEIPVLVTEQYSKGLGSTIPSLKLVPGNFSPIEKLSFSCCDEPDFLKKLNGTNKKNVILAGIETHVCVLQTAIDLVQLGYQPVIVEDCTSSRNPDDKYTAVKRMRQEGALVSSMESILFELTRSSGTDTFKMISKLLK